MLAQEVITVAQSQLGVSEVPKGSNSGKQVNAYLRSVDLAAGNPWCMAFVYWCVDKAAENIGVKNLLVKTGSCLHQYNNTTLRKIPNRSKAIKAGDIFIMEFKGGTGHTGFVTKVTGGLIETIEGNTNDDGSREGYEVAKRTRTISSIKGFIQL
jgi:CHAP domain